MLFNTKNLSLAGLLLLSSSVTYAAPVTANFGAIADGGTSFNQFNVNVTSDITVNVSGWSDTKNGYANQNGASDGDGDNVIQRAHDLDKFNGGWAMENKDEKNNSTSCYNTSDGHSADNFGSCDWGDYDFFMLAFSEEVSLTEATYGWINQSNNNINRNQVSVVALDTTQGLNNTLENKTWNDVKNIHTLSSDSAQMQNNNGYFTNFANTNVGGEFSTHWLIGALNSVFGTNAGDSLNNDGMKLAGVSFNTKPDTPPQVVPEPSSIMLFGLAIIGFAASNRRKLK